MSFILLGILNSQAAGVAAGSFDLLESTVLTSSASSVSFTGLDSYTDYKHLQIRATHRTDRANTADSVLWRLNNDTGTNYYNHYLRGFPAASSTPQSGGFSASYGYFPTRGDNDTSGIFGFNVLDILDFASSNKNTTARNLSGVVGTTSNPETINLISSLWNDTSAVTSISLLPSNGPNFITGSRFSIYGIKAA